MKNGVIALVIVAAVFGSDFCHPASAQSALGGPQKHNALGGAMKQTSPVLPMNKGGSVAITAPSSRPPPPPPPPPSPPPPSSSALHAKCGPGPCVAKGPK